MTGNMLLSLKATSTKNYIQVIHRPTPSTTVKQTRPLSSRKPQTSTMAFVNKIVPFVFTLLLGFPSHPSLPAGPLLSSHLPLSPGLPSLPAGCPPLPAIRHTVSCAAPIHSSHPP